MLTVDDIFEARRVIVDSIVLTYRLYRPRRLEGALPVILFLHGAGESGSDGLSQTTVGLGPAVRKDPDAFPAYVIFPQASRGYGWRGFNLDAAFAALDDVAGSFAIDPSRIIVTGISMGGYGTWLALLRDPQRFAAAVPVCGGLDAGTAVRLGLIDAQEPHSSAAKRIAHVPQWVFHGDADDIIPVAESRAMVEALNAAGAAVRYTEYARVRHNSWDRAYAEPGLIEWMLSQRKA